MRNLTISGEEYCAAIMRRVSPFLRRLKSLGPWRKEEKRKGKGRKRGRGGWKGRESMRGGEEEGGGEGGEEGKGERRSSGKEVVRSSREGRRGEECG